MLILRIRQAECALADGRLDEAYQIVQADQLAQHRRGQKLVGALARALAQRGQEHLDENRVQYALQDCNKAEKLAGSLPQVGTLREAICESIENRYRQNEARSLKLDQAKKHIEDGWISAGEQILADADDHEAQILLQRAAAARGQIDEAVDKADQALRRSDLEAAIDLVRRADAANNHNGRLAELTAQIRDQAIRQTQENVNTGRMDLAGSLLQRLASIANGSSQVAQLRRIVTQCNQAAEHIATGRPASAVPLLRKVKTLVPAATWINAAIDQAQRAAALMEDLGTGPLGLGICEAASTHLPLDEPPKDNGSAQPHEPEPLSPRKPIQAGAGSYIPTRFEMQVDGVGGYLVLRDDRVTIGPISSSARPLVGLMAEPHLPSVTIERVDGDYFLRSDRPIEVSGKSVTEKLLVDGDRIALSPRCRMRFNLPNPASTTAVLSLSSAKLGRADIRTLILMDRDLLIGPTRGQHIATERADRTIAFTVQDDRLFCRAADAVRVGANVLSPGAPLPMAQQIRIGRVSLALTQAHT